MIVILIVIIMLALSSTTVYAGDTIDELFDLYDRQDMYDNLSLYKEWLSIKNRYDGLLSEMEMVEMFNKFYDVALSNQEMDINKCYEDVNDILLINSQIEESFYNSIMFSPDTLISWDAEYKVNVSRIDSILSSVNSYNLPENRVFNYDDLNELASTLESYSDIEEIKVVNLSLLKPPISDYTIDAGYGVRYSSTLNTIVHNNGVDLIGNDNLVRNIMTGTVISIGESPVDGKFIVVDNGSGVKTYYSNLDIMYVDIGDTVSQNRLLGTAGKRYNVNMIHFGIYFNNISVNPEVLLGVIGNEN